MPLRKFQPDPALAPLMAEWRRLQLDLAARAELRSLDVLPRFVAGVDAAYSRDGTRALAAAVVWDRETRAAVEVAHAAVPLLYPYIPGYLSFREGPAVLAALRALRSPFGAVLFDGMGIAHPRRCGIAVHMAVTLGVAGAGIGKSRLYGRHEEPGPGVGDAAPLWDPARPEEQIGWVLRTRENVRPVYVSPGHRIDLASSLGLARACLGGYRLPEPTRLADREVAAFKAAERDPAAAPPGEAPAGESRGLKGPETLPGDAGG